MADQVVQTNEAGDNQGSHFHEHHVTHDEQPQLTHKILIAIDHCETSAYAFSWYLENVHRPQNRVILINVVEPPSMHGAVGFGAAAYEWKRECDQRMETAKELQQQYAHDMKEAGLHGKVVAYCDDKAGHGICKYAETEKVDLIVIGARGAGKLRRTFMGTHSDYVLHHCHIPVLVVPKDRHHHAQHH